MNEPTPVQRLTEALDVWLAWKARPDRTREDLLAAHDDLRDLLEPLVAEPPASGGDEPRAFGEYRLVREIGRGGMGIVYEALQQSLGRRVALKVLASPVGAGGAGVARFRRESELLARLQHAHIVPVYDAGIVDDVPFHAMELIDGCMLAAVVAELAVRRSGPLDGHSLAHALRRCLDDPGAGTTLVAESHVAACLRLIVPIAEALAAAHAHGVVHRDVKPANILLRRDGTSLLSDFGLARELADAGVTRSGDFAGTPHYVSPEQVRGDLTRLDGRTDVFSLAVVAYELLFVARPFDGDTTDAVLRLVCHAPPPRLHTRHAGLPADLVAVLDKAMQKDPTDRYATMAEFAQDLAAVLALRPVRARRRGPVTRAWQALRRQPLRAGVGAVLALTLTALLGLSAYVWSQQARIASATTAERLPQVERLLESMLLHQDFDDDEHAREPAERALALLPDLPEAIAAMAVVEFRAGDLPALAAMLQRLDVVAPDVAVQMRQQCEAPEPESALAWFVRGMLRIERGHATGGHEHYLEAAAAIRRAMQRAPQPRAMFHGQYLHALMHLRDAARIRELTTDTMHRWPDSAFAAYWCGFALQNVDPEAARALLEKAIALAPDLPQPLARQAKILEQEDRHAEAYALYLRAQALQPTLGVPQFGLVRTLCAMNRVDEATKLASELVQRLPKSWRAQHAYAQALVAKGEHEAALAAFGRAIEMVPRMAQPRLSRASALVDLGRAKEALADAEAALALDPENAMCHSVCGTVLLHLGRPADAIARFQRVVADRPDETYGWKALAAAYRRCKQLDEALAAAQRAIETSPRAADGFRELGKTQQARGDVPAATAAFERAIELDPADGEARVNLAVLRHAAGRADEALALLTAARAAQPKLGPAWTVSLRILQDLGRDRETIAVHIEQCRAFPRDRQARCQLAQAMLAAPPVDGDDEVLARTFAELEVIDGGTREDVLAMREQAATRQRSGGRTPLSR